MFFVTDCEHVHLMQLNLPMNMIRLCEMTTNNFNLLKEEIQAKC